MLAAFRIHLAGHPLVLTLASLAAAWLVCRVASRGRRLTWTGPALSIISAAALVVYAGVVVFYATDPHYFDAAEPTVTAIGWLFKTGQPIHHAVDSAERYAHIYGPVTYIAHGVALAMFGPRIEVSKWVGGSTALLSLVLIVVALRPHVGVRRAAVLAGLTALLMLGFRNYSFWTRPEPLLTFCVSAGLVAAVRGKGYVAGGVLGVFAGLLLNLKLTGALYSLPLFVILLRRIGWRQTFVSGAVASVVAVLPFVMLPDGSLANYWAWFRLSAGNGLTRDLFTRNLEWAAYFLLPLLLAAYAARRMSAGSEDPASEDPRDASSSEAGSSDPAFISTDWRLVTWTTVATAGLVVIAGSKPGAGPYHLLPLLPVIAFLVAQRMGRQAPENTSVGVQLALVSFVVVAVAIAFVQQVQFVTTMEGRRGLHEIRDIEAFVEQHPGVVQMGYGVDDPMTYERPVLVFRSNVYLLDAPAVGEHQLAGVVIPAATLDALRQCRVNYWLIPKGEAPFTGRNLYPAVFQQPLFPEEFQRVFHETHTLTTSTEYFDAWQCHPIR